MKRFLQFLFVSLIIVTSAFSLFEFSKQYKINAVKNNLKWNIVAKNCRGCVGFDKDSNGKIYIAYKDYVKCVEEDGRENIIFKDENLNIENILLNNNKIYLISNDEVKQYDLKEEKFSTILSKIPYKGEYLNRNLIMKDNKLLLSIGSATNSGIAEKKNECDIHDIPYDVSPINITLNGYNYGNAKTGGFMPYGNSSEKDTKVEAKTLGNASIVQIDLAKKNKVSLYACGIRNVKGWDVNSNNDLVAVVGGMENKGVRPISRDFDYLYKVEKGNWYGWPDFSGGDPITSPRFKGQNAVTPLIKNPPNKIVSAPLYQYDNVNTIKFLAIDKGGEILQKDSSIFYDSKDNMIKSISPDLVEIDLLKLKDESKIAGIKYIDKSVYILDSGMGCIYKMIGNSIYSKFVLPKEILMFLITFALILIITIIIKLNKKIRN